MLHTLEQKFKHLLSLTLRFLVGSRSISLPLDSEFNRILVVRQHNQLGDMLCAVPLLRALRERYPHAFIVLMASPINCDVMRNNRFINSVINYDKREFLGKGIDGWRKLVEFFRDLRAKGIELVIVPSTVSVSFTSGLLAYLSGARVRIGAASLNGIENPSAFFFNVPVELDWRTSPLRHQTQRNIDIGRPLALESGSLELEITLDSSELDADNLFWQSNIEQSKIVIAYHIGAGKIPNRWQVDKFAEVANTIAREFKATTLITSGPMDDGPVGEIIQLLSAPYLLIKRKSIREVAAILAKVSLVVTNDTGIMHVAAAVGAPVLSLFGPTEPEQWAPIGRYHRWLRGKEGDINNISVDEVLRTAREMLKQ